MLTVHLRIHILPRDFQLHKWCGSLFAMPIARIDSLDDAFKWPHHFLETMSPDEHARISDKFAAGGGLKLSTCFSGVCAPSTALSLIAVVFHQFFCPTARGLVTSADHLPQFTYCSAREWDAECKLELL